jgi:hypothetical protein
LQILPRCGKVISRRAPEPPSDGYKRPWPRSLRAAQRRDAADKRRSNGARFARAFINAPLAADLGVSQIPSMTAAEAIRDAEALLPGKVAPDGEIDPRWQAVIAVSDHIPDDPEAVWLFIARWGQHEDEDLRTAIATCALEDILEHHFDSFFPRVEELVRSSRRFADTFSRCWKFGQADEPSRAAQFDRLQAECARLSTE